MGEWIRFSISTALSSNSFQIPQNFAGVPAVAYVALNTGIESRPTREYLNFLLEGEHLLSPEYVTKLEEIATL